MSKQTGFWLCEKCGAEGSVENGQPTPLHDCNPTPPATGEEKVSHDEAETIALKFINGHLRNYGKEWPRTSIPADPTRDDDLRLMRYIREQKATASTLATLREDNAVFAQFIRELLGTMPDEISIDKDGDVAEALARAKEPT